MIRDANFADIPAITDMIADRYRLTHYAKDGTVDIDVDEIKRLLRDGIHRHGGKNGGSTFVQIADKGGLVTGLIFGTLVRVYSIGNKLSATDLFWLATPLVEPHEPERLMRNMIEWAWKSPLVAEVKCGATAVITNDPMRVGKVLERVGMENYGQIFRMERAA